jgi:hypothetical protein
MLYSPNSQDAARAHELLQHLILPSSRYLSVHCCAAVFQKRIELGMNHVLSCGVLALTLALVYTLVVLSVLALMEAL